MSDTDVRDSILLSTKQLLGLEPEELAFDTDIIFHINSVFSTLYQLGVGPTKPFSIADETAKWSDFIQRDDIETVKSYMYLKVRLLFDPPSTTTMYEAVDKQTKELEWRLNAAVDYDMDGGDDADDSVSDGDGE